MNHYKLKGADIKQFSVDRKRGKTLGRNENSTLSKPKGNISWQFEKLKRYKNLFQKRLA